MSGISALPSAPLHKLLAEGPDGPCFGPPAESLSLCSRERESNQRESAPDHSAPAVPGFPRSGAAPGARREGTSLSLRDSLGVLPRVPLRDTCARPPERESVPSCLKALLPFLWLGLSGNAGCPLQEAERNRRGRGRAARMPREPRWAMDGPSRRAPGTAM